MIISLNEMYIGETAEITSFNTDDICAKRLQDMGLRVGKLLDLLQYGPLGSKKVIVKVDNSKIAFDADIASKIKVRPLKSYYEVLKTQATYDNLTGCLNRHAIECILMREYEKFKIDNIPLSLLLADVDHFKRINDTYGHDVGDMILKSISNLFKKILRRSDSLCRWGGEEFLILLRGTLIVDAVEIAQRLRQTVESNIFQPFRGSGFVTVSIGGCGLPPEVPIEQIIKHADVALYEAKNKGRNRVNLCGV